MALSTPDAVKRVELIVPMLTGDVRRALALHAVIRAANDTLKPELEGQKIPGADAFNLVHEALMLKLAMDAARIYDWSAGRSAEDQDKASIPVLAGLLERDDVAGVFVERSRDWIPGFEASQVKACRNAIAAIIKADAERFREGSELAQALRRVRDYRTRRLAHMLFDKAPEELPTYPDVFSLITAAKPVVKAARLAIEGASTEPDWEVDQWKRSAEVHYGLLLAGIKARPR